MARTVPNDMLKLGFHFYSAFAQSIKLGNEPIHDWNRMTPEDKLYFNSKAHKLMNDCHDISQTVDTGVYDSIFQTSKFLKLHKVYIPQIHDECLFKLLRYLIDEIIRYKNIKLILWLLIILKFKVVKCFMKRFGSSLPIDELIDTFKDHPVYRLLKNNILY